MSKLTKHLVLASALLVSPLPAEQVRFATQATNELGLELYRLLAPDNPNLCLSPYSIQSAFAMTANGANGKTLEEMQRVLHYPPVLSHLNNSFLALAGEFAARQASSEKLAKQFGPEGGEPDFQLMIANRLFGQKDHPFAPAFLDTIAKSYAAPLQFADFKSNYEKERKNINRWVKERTRDRIVDLLPVGSLNADTRLVLTNALYFKAAWRHSFSKPATGPASFRLRHDKLIEIPTMQTTQSFGHSNADGYTAVTLPYAGGFAMLVIVPDEVDGLSDIERQLTADQLSLLARLPSRSVSLHLPKFKIESPSISLRKSLEKLGMSLPFNCDLANFEPMTSDKSLPGLFISDAYHKTFLAVDEIGTEAAAATAILMADPTAAPSLKRPVELRVDRPFFYAIIDTSSRTVLFLGRVMDPR